MLAKENVCCCFFVIVLVNFVHKAIRKETLSPRFYLSIWHNKPTRKETKKNKTKQKTIEFAFFFNR